MTDSVLDTSVRTYRERLGLSQQDLAELSGVTRQAIIAIEQGRQVPSTTLSLRLARALECTVEQLFQLRQEDILEVHLAPHDDHRFGSRVAVGFVGGKWVAHRLPLDATSPADGIVVFDTGLQAGQVRPLVNSGQLRRNVLVAGCAPLLGTLTRRVGSRFTDAYATWLLANSYRSLDLLQAKLIHIAGLHASDSDSVDANVALIRERFHDERMLVVNLTRWREGLVLPKGNPLDIRSGGDLLRPSLRFALREQGASARKLLRKLVADAGATKEDLKGPLAFGHAEVAQMVRAGAADVGIAIESEALAAELDFLPLTEERFDLVVPASLADSPPVSRLLDTISDPGFRAEMAQLPGYDSELSGHVTTLEVA